MKSSEKAEANYTSRSIESSLVRMLFVCLLLLTCGAANSVIALDPDKFLTQYGHTAWRVLDGYLASPTAITQTKDGYIWIGTRDGLVRFDGVKFTPWTPPEGQDFPGKNVSYLLGASDGSLWVGTTNGAAHVKDGQIINYAPPKGTGGIGSIIEDETGAVWFTRYRVSDGKGPLCRVKDREIKCFGKEDNMPVNYGQGLAKDARGNIWIGSSELCRWSPESSEVFFEEELKHKGGDGVNVVAVAPSGEILAGIDATGAGLGVRHYSDGKWSSFTMPGFNGEKIRAYVLYIDRNDSLWIGTASDGLYRIHNGVADHYAMKDGLSGNTVGTIFEDREGNVWVQTESGVDMFRDTPVVSFSSREGLSLSNTTSILGLRNGEVWIASPGAVDIVQPGARSAITTLDKLPGQNLQTMVEDSAGRVWIGMDEKLVIYENGRFSEPEKLDGSSLSNVGTAWAITADAEDNIWAGVFSDNKRRLLRFKDRILQKDIPLDDFIVRAEKLLADKQGAVWIASAKDKLVHYSNGKMDTVSLAEDGSTTIYELFLDTDDALLAVTNKGLYRWKDGALSLLDTRNGLPCVSLYSALNDNSGNLWLYARCGLLKIPASDAANWRNNHESQVSVKTFDALDGALAGAGAVNQPRSAKSVDGRLWFINGRAAQMIDSSRDFTNVIQPPVYMEGITADHKSYQIQDHINLPPLKSELEIDYTALSYAAPRKINFRYKLEGHDDDWQNVGNRRQAFYSNLRPGHYRFIVNASNSDGIWNEAGAALDFNIEPFWYQTTLFRAFCLLLSGLILWALYRLRIRQISSAISARFDERMAERARLARDLHDTLFQTIQASKMIADDALEQTNDPARLQRAVEQLSVWLGHAAQEGRAAVNSLRASTMETNDLAEALRRASEDCQLRKHSKVIFSVTGDDRDLHPIVRDEIYHIGYEAIRNACRHSQASRLEINLKYNHNLYICVKDNGIGIDPLIISKGKEGHFGLKGMRERAARIGAKLIINSSINAGTEVILTVSGKLVFHKPDESASEI